MFSALRAFSAIHSASVETSLNLAAALVASNKRLMAFSINAACKLASRSTADVKALLSTDDIDDLLRTRMAQTQALVALACDYANGIDAIVSETGGEIANITAARGRRAQ